MLAWTNSSNLGFLGVLHKLTQYNIVAPIGAQGLWDPNCGITGPASPRSSQGTLTFHGPLLLGPASESRSSGASNNPPKLSGHLFLWIPSARHQGLSSLELQFQEGPEGDPGPKRVMTQAEAKCCWCKAGTQVSVSFLFLGWPAGEVSGSLCFMWSPLQLPQGLTYSCLKQGSVTF